MPEIGIEEVDIIERQTDRQRRTDRKTDRQTDRQTDRDRQTQRTGETERHRVGII